MKLINLNTLLAHVELLSSLGVASQAHAATSYVLPTVSVRAGTLGIGPELDVRIPNTPFGIRAGVYGFNLDRSNLYHDTLGVDVDGFKQSLGVSYGGSVKLLNGALTADWYPWKRDGFRVSAGVNYNKSQFKGEGTAEGTLELPAEVVSAAGLLGEHIQSSYSDGGIGTLNARITPRTVAPYFGVGYSAAVFHHLSLSFDAGVLYEGALHGSITATGEATSLTQVQTSVANAQNSLTHALKEVPVWPVAMVGIGYRF